MSRTSCALRHARRASSLHLAHDGRIAALRVVARQAGLDHVVGAAPLLAVRHLPRQDRRAAAPRVMPGRRSTRQRCTAAGAVTTTTRSQRPCAAGLEQQRDVEHHQPLRPAPGGGEEAPLGIAHQRMDDALQPAAAPRGLPSTARRSASRSTRPSRTVPGKAAPIGRDRAAAARPAARAPRHRRRRPARAGGGRCAAAVDLPMPMPPVRPRIFIGRGMSPPTKSRSSASTSGATPNQASKPGRAWCSSIPSPSTAAQAARPGGGQQRRLPRDIDDVGHHRARPAAAARSSTSGGCPCMPSEVVFTSSAAPASGGAVGDRDRPAQRRGPAPRPAPGCGSPG